MDNKKGVDFVSSAENKVYIDAEKDAAVSKPQTGEEKGSDAGRQNNKEAEFERLIKGEYREQFASRVKKIIDRRLKEVKNMKENSEKNAKIVDMLMKRYNVPEGDTDELERVISEEMDNNNQSNKQVKSADDSAKDMLLKRLVAENAYLKRRQEEENRKAQANSRIAQWREQAQETKKAYPNFEFEEELKSEQFRALIKAGVSVKQAYEVVHLNTILADNSKNAEKKVVNSIRSKGSRPVENGSDSGGGILLSNDVSKLTKKQRAELAQRAARGEKIEF